LLFSISLTITIIKHLRCFPSNFNRFLFPKLWDCTKLGVSEQNIAEAVDYYHAVEHISDLISKLRKLDKKKQDTLFKELKDLLWEGKLEQFILTVTHLANGRKLILDKLNYFHKNVA